MYKNCCVIDKKTGKEACILQSVKVEANLDNGISEVLIKQHFKNPGKDNIEAVYIFPMPNKAEVTELVAKIGDAEVVGEIKEKEEAYKEYDNAVRKGDTAFLLDSKRPDIFQIWLGNIGEGEDVTIELTYTEEIKITDQEVRWVLPTVVAPRYIPGSVSGNKNGVGTSMPTDRVPDADEISPPIGNTSYTLDVNVRINGITGVKKVSSPSHPIEVEVSKGDYQVKLARENEPLDSDFILVINTEKAMGNILLTASDSSDETFGYSNLYIDLESSEKLEKNCEYFFLIDVSGSMMGEKFEQAKRALHISLRNLLEGDSFNLIAFESSYRYFSKDAVLYSQKNLEKADNWIESLSAGGGTEIFEPLNYLFGRISDVNDKEKIILLFTDGEVGNESEIHDLVRKNNDGLRLFPFGIDTAVNRFFIDGLAEAGNGISEYVYPGERIEDKVIRQFSRIHLPYIENAVVLDGEGNKIDILPKLPKRIYDSESYSFVFRNEGNVKIDRITVKGDFEHEKKELSINEAGTGNARLMSLRWAKEKIKEYEGQFNKGNKRRDNLIKQDIIDLSTKYGVLSTLTSFVAVYKRTVKVKGIPQTIVIPVEKPRMWDMMCENTVNTSLNRSAPVVSRMAFRSAPASPRGISMESVNYKAEELCAPPSAAFEPAEPNMGKDMKKRAEVSNKICACDKEDSNYYDVSSLPRLASEKQNADGSFGKGGNKIENTSFYIVGMLLSKTDWKPYKIQINKAAKILLDDPKADLMKAAALYLVLENKIIKSMKSGELSKGLAEKEAEILKAVMDDDFTPLSDYLKVDISFSSDKKGELSKILLSKLV